MEDQLKICENCQKQFPSDRIDLHEAYCVRNFRKCQQCSLMIDLNYIEDHNKQYHEKKECPLCKEPIQSNNSDHQQICLERIEKCKYCDLDIAFKNMKIHEVSCGNQPKGCIICNKLIPIRQLQGHLIRCQRRRQRRLERQGSQEQIPHNRQIPREERHSTNKYIKPANERSSEKLRIPNPKIKEKNIIKPEVYRPFISPIPLSVMKAMELKEKKKEVKITQETD